MPDTAPWCSHSTLRGSGPMASICATMRFCATASRMPGAASRASELVHHMTQQLLDQSAQLVVLYRRLAHLPCLPSPRTARPAPA
jgi:hypothetical protein